MAEESGGKFTYFLAGLGIGTLIGILFAPQSGEETRNQIRTRVDDGREYLTKRSQELRGQAEELVDRGRKTVSRQKDNLQAAVEAGKQAYREASTRTETAES
jgi:gas vesicle protein